MSFALDLVKAKVNTHFKGKQPYIVWRDTIAALVILYYGTKAAKAIQRDGAKKAFMKFVFSFVKHVPLAKDKIEGEKAKILKKLESVVLGSETAGEPKWDKLPARGEPQDKLLQLMKKWKKSEENKWKEGQVSGGVYHGGQALLSFLVEAYGYFALSNPLHPDVFPFVRKMEAEVVSMTVNLFNGREGCCGAMTSGGTESILMAMKAYRDQAREERGITNPNIVMPITAHAAFDKAGHYFGIEVIKIPVDQTTFKVDTAAMRRAMNRNTIALVGSAPGFPQGVVDDITTIAAMADEAKIGMHVDCCLGGFLMPFLSKIGYNPPAFDFSVRGVTTISADTHKYGFAPKGSSVVMFSSKQLRHHMYFVSPEWPGGIYASPTMSGSRAGGLIAATWAAMVSLGEDGYMDCARAIMEAAKKIEKGVSSIDGLRVQGSPDMSVISFCSDEKSARGRNLNIFKVGEAMTKRHWSLNVLQKPAAIHICCTYMHRHYVDKFLADLQDAVKDVLENPDNYKSGSAAIYGATESIPDTSLVSDMAKGFLDALFTV